MAETTKPDVGAPRPSHPHPHPPTSVPGARRRIARGTLVPAPAAYTVEDALPDLPWLQTYGRYLVTIPALLLLNALFLVTLPLGLVLSVGVDLYRRNSFCVTRCYLTFGSVIVAHVIGGTPLVVVWIFGGRWFGYKPKRWLEWNRAIENWWGNFVIRIPEVFFGTKIEIEGDELFENGPIIALSRHCSIFDTMLPLRIAGYWHGQTIRLVKKHMLLWDAPVCSIGRRVPAAFIRRGADDVDRELEALRRLTRAMGPSDIVWMFPEGTRRTEAKHARILETLRRTRPHAVAAAERYQAVLPPKPAGTLALIDSAPRADVVFCAHTGLEGANELEDFAQGSLLGRTIRVKIWRVAAADIPTDSAAREQWLADQWLAVDEWVLANRDPDIEKYSL